MARHIRHVHFIQQTFLYLNRKQDSTVAWNLPAKAKDGFKKTVGLNRIRGRALRRNIDSITSQGKNIHYDLIRRD